MNNTPHLSETFRSIERFPFRNPIDLADHINHIISGKVLCDIGCGAGDILEYCRIKNYCTKVIGVECNHKRYVEGRDYIRRGDIFQMDIPVADVYFLWHGRSFPFSRLLRKLKREAIIINGGGDTGPGSSHNKILETPGILFISHSTYPYDERKYVPKEEMTAYLRRLQKMAKEVNQNWTIVGSRDCRVYKFTPPTMTEAS